MSFYDFVPDYKTYSFEELVDVFIQIDDIKLTNRAVLILKLLAAKLEVDIVDFEMELIIPFPTEPFGRESYFDREYSMDESYTRDAVEVRDKLVRLKKFSLG